LYFGLDPVRDISQIEARDTRPGLAFISALHQRMADVGARRFGGAGISACGRGGIAVHRVQHRLDLVQLTFDRHSRSAIETICAGSAGSCRRDILHEIAELLLRARRDPADLIDDLGKFRRRHRLIGEGVEPFSISPIMFCHIAAGSLLLSAMAPSSVITRALEPAFF
jgi:hypothetical protein